MNYWVKNNVLTVYEHFEKEIELPEDIKSSNLFYQKLFPKTRGNIPCYTLKKSTQDKKAKLTTGYFIGVDRLEGTDKVIYVAPKLNSKENSDDKDAENGLVEVDYLQMLLEGITSTSEFKNLEDLVIIKWEEDEIELPNREDFLTPFLVVQFIGVLHSIVRKGLKKSYYKTEKNLNNKIKGKVLISQTVRQNHFKHKFLSNVCSIEEFGHNGIENRLFKKTLNFVNHYFNSHHTIIKNEKLYDALNFITPAFAQVSADIELTEIKTIKPNPFFQEYKTAIDLSQKILKRFGYNISNQNEKVQASTPPFWIDMSKLFELYVLGKLKKELNEKVEFQFDGKGGNELDFVIGEGTNVIIADAKYKPWYKYNWNEKMNDDVRQVSGYSRLVEVRKRFEIPDDVVPNGLIIYPDLKDGGKTFSFDSLLETEIEHYKNIYKVGIKIPLQEN